MSSTSDDTQAAMTYPTVDQYERWKDRAAELDMSVSEFVQSMVEAGIKVDKGFEVELERDETRQELRAQRNDLRDELEHARNRIDELEEHLYCGERAALIDHVQENPGISHGELGQYLVDTVSNRLPDYIEELEGEEIRIEHGSENDRYYPVDESEGEQ